MLEQLEALEQAGDGVGVRGPALEGAGEEPGVAFADEAVAGAARGLDLERGDAGGLGPEHAAARLAGGGLRAPRAREGDAVGAEGVGEEDADERGCRA
ncbi:MAG: hypothetical protein ACKOUK_05825, partial [Verrucomicrobiota bacterium]